MDNFELLLKRLQNEPEIADFWLSQAFTMAAAGNVLPYQAERFLSIYQKVKTDG